ncbi:unnamed protein product [Toxocara canis]|uniref:RNase_Zc3h12a_2 domain-containing protein n=1 Tax=Toxocara canis TaxID=6265 RepID=A0A183U2N8_TOXCA|nr:unnamed protein product [Toxocara canis]
MHGTRASPWECDAKGRLLSVIVAADKALPYITGRDYDPLRPIFIDGPSIAHAYDDRYHLYGHIYPNRNHFDENALQPRRTAHRFPVLALVQTLFTFISRGHKTIVLMPSVYNERSTNRIICHDMSALIDDVKVMRKLIEMNLVEFIDDEKNFALAIRQHSKKVYGALITCSIIEQLDILDNSEKKMRKKNKKNNKSGIHESEENSEPIKAASGTDKPDNDDHCNSKVGTIDSEQFETAESSSASTEPLKMSDARFADKLPIDFLPIIRPIFYNVISKRQLLIPLDSPCFCGVFPTTEQLLVFQTRVDGYAAISELAKNWQLTLSKQSRLLEELDSLLKGRYPRGLKEKRVAELVKQTWQTSKERVCDDESVTDSDDAISDSVKDNKQEHREALSQLSELAIFDDDFLVDEMNDKRQNSETSSILSDLILFDDDFAAEHNLIEF